MNDLICPFGATLAKDDFACTRAEKIIRRGGAEFACQDSAAHKRCCTLHENLKATALPAFNLEDDLLAVPHGVLSRIQFGGLLGLQRLVTGSPGEKVDDIATLVDDAATRFIAIEQVPFDQLVDDITHYTLARRRRR
ncbi:MAG TPA: hypothetical protein VLB10_07175 [Gammaproteobacteria bacterium]|nr:hypothetical protein [Gammaproteobacteria bacterium]